MKKLFTLIVLLGHVLFLHAGSQVMKRHKQLIKQHCYADYKHLCVLK